MEIAASWGGWFVVVRSSRERRRMSVDLDFRLSFLLNILRHLMNTRFFSLC
ncbi:unnamed protein product [Amoebophrya sp. A25]|nr:unnamed protein product [Amoebophrya sp. A25]|eukprot:GSA25T00019908001.1